LFERLKGKKQHLIGLSELLKEEAVHRDGGRAPCSLPFSSFPVRQLRSLRIPFYAPLRLLLLLLLRAALSSSEDIPAERQRKHDLLKRCFTVLTFVSGLLSPSINTSQFKLLVRNKLTR
jgi:hypothetical protein